MAEQGVLPPVLGEVLPGRRSPWVAIVSTTALAPRLITCVRTRSGSNIVSAPSATTGLLLLAVVAVVDVACLVLRREDTGRGFRAPTVIGVVPWAVTGCSTAAAGAGAPATRTGSSPVRSEPELRGELARRARAEGTTTSAIVREALRSHLRTGCRPRAPPA